MHPYNDKNTCLFPYINHSYRSSNSSFGNVCLDTLTDGIKNSFKSLNFVDMSLKLLSWAQYYNFKHSNPYNNPIHLLP